MFCLKCGKQIPEGSQVCNFCGFSIAVYSHSPAAQTATVTKTSGWAIAALICGILTPFTCGITAILAIIFGIIALVKINASRGAFKGKGLAITGIVLPIVLVPMLVLMSILMPALAKAREQAQRIISANRLKNITLALMNYADEHDNKLPTSLNEELIKYLGTESKEEFSKILESPRKPKNFQGLSYIFVQAERTVMSQASDIIIVYENPEFCKDGVNVAFLDGHIEFMRPEEFRNALRATYMILNKPMPEINFRE